MPVHRSPRRLAALAVALLAVLLLGSSCPIGAPDELGFHAVGRTTITVVDADRDDRTLPVDIWYPAQDDGAPPSVYDLLVASIVSDVALDEPPVAEGEFPLLVFSHGSGGVRIQSIFLVEHLASHGFIVVAPDHVGNTATDILLPEPPPFTAADRPLDVSLVIDEMLDRDADPVDPFHGAVDESRIGVLGHSFGGFTTLAMVSGFGDVERDPRVKAIMPIAPAVGGLPAELLEKVDVPTFVLGGTLDDVTPVEPNSRRAFEETNGLPRWRVDVLDAGHNSFTEICLFFEVLVDAGLPAGLLEFLLGSADQGCGPDLIPIEEAQRITKLYATAFFKKSLARQGFYGDYLMPEYVDEAQLPVDFWLELWTKQK